MSDIQNNPTVVITGCAGFIGSTLAERCLQSEMQVIGIDNFHPYYPRPLKESNLQTLKKNSRFFFFERDFADLRLWKELTQQFRIQSIVHFAAFAGVRPSLSNPLAYYENNVTKTVQLLEIMRTAQIENLLFTSSSSVYGGVKTLPFSESQKVDQPVSPYAATKKAGEEIISTYCFLYGLKAMSFRLFTVFGPRQRPDLAIRKFMSAVKKQQKITLFGDGSSQRDYTFVSDIVDGYMAALEKIKNTERGAHDIFNLGAGRAIRLLEMIQSIESVLGQKAQIEFAARHPADLEATLADISKAEQLLNYRPKVSFQQGLNLLYDWLRTRQTTQDDFTADSIFDI